MTYIVEITVNYKIRVLKKQREDEKRKHDDFIDAMKYALGESGAT